MPMVVAPLRTALIVRSTLPAPALEAALRAAIREVVPRTTVSDFELVTARLADARETHRFTLGLIGAFAGLALLLAAIGLGAVISYSVSQRMREMGIRIALGAQSSQVARLVLGQGVVLAAIGVVAGSAAGLAATRLMQSMLYGVSPGDPLTTAAVALLLLVVSALACALPARRATRVDPVEMVRAE
jgi:ABC-type antimicrobial peptide transport system permease subunit